MANFVALMKEEISRLARKEVKTAVAPAMERISSLKQTVSEQKKSITALEKELKTLKKKLGVEDKKSAAVELSDEVIESARITAKTVSSLRAKLELSRNQMAKLLGVNANSIYLWEQDKASPRNAAKAEIIKLRSMGKREIKKMLEELGL
jgi:DNA-binding transcriptional regulator YiaG